MNLLIIRISHLSDILLASPLVRCLKQQLPDANIHFLTYDVNGPAVEHNPNIDKVFLVAHSWELAVAELKTESYDCIIDLQNDHRSAKIKSNIPVRALTLNDHETKKAIYTGFKINLMPATHRVDRYFKTIESLGVKNDGQGLDYFLDVKDETKREDIPVSHHAGYIACAIDANFMTRKWPLDSWKEFVAGMDHPIILVGEKDDIGWAEEIASVNPVKVYNACGKFTTNETADLIKKARLLITHDNDWMQVGAAFRRPVISIWGNTVPSFGSYPYYGGSSKESKKLFDILQVNKLSCRPCSDTGYGKCPRGHFKCMRNISVRELTYAVRKWL